MAWRNVGPVVLALVGSVAWLVLVWTWELPGGPAGFLLLAVGCLLTVAAVLVAYRFGRRRTGPRAKLVVVARRAALRAGPGPAAGWICAGLTFYLVILLHSRVVGVPAAWTEGPVEFALEGFMVMVTLLFAAMVAALLRAVLTDRPRIDLTPEAIEVGDRFGSYRVPWTALAPGSGWAPAQGQVLDLPVVRPDLVTCRGLLWPHRPPVFYPTLLVVDSGYLWRVLRYYAEHPGERAGLGTEAGYRRLRAALD